ncbi:hypothetical protein EHV15_10230 [Paenibacillus oralis]|uniref:Uncharacterized protein n=1 Tax=Paenibacillus oralis TaxID=2490856 RepID=A0A3P3TZN4_9BACL|nr:hypothetical protein [Paenibacillus oralis]RRJ63254.1 hypothetical protein EHV15_10230 [Paenibacillus oralis]
MEEGLSNVISGAIGAIAGLAGGFTTTWFQARIATRKETIEKKFQVYNKILEQDGASCVLQLVDVEFQMDIAEYIQKVRPHLFAGFHLLNSDMRNRVLEIDKLIELMNNIEDMDEAMLKECALNYARVIQLVKDSYVEQFGEK